MTTKDGLHLINLPIIELAGITKVLYEDESENYHFDVSYLCAINGNDEMVLNCYPVHKAQLLALPLITEDTEIQVMQQIENGSIPVRKTTVRDQI